MSTDTLDKYAERFSDKRQETRLAMEDVWNNVPEAQQFNLFASLREFSEFAVSQKRLRQSQPHKVIAAMLCMRLGGYRWKVDHRGVMSWYKPKIRVPKSVISDKGA